VLEAGFLVLLAVVVGFAELDPPLIILVMTVGWLLVSLIEYFAWRQTRTLAMSRFEEAPAPAMREEVVEDVPLPPPPPVEDETIVTPPAAEAPPAEAPPEKASPEEASPEEAPPAEPEARAEAAPTKFGAAERRTVHRLEPLQPRPGRRWILFGRRDRQPEPPAEGDREEEQ
jgi:hypothetical protein